jgi:hypothetical protein
MKVYAAIIEDRHVDTDVEIFTTDSSAIDWARNFAKKYARHQDDYQEVTIPGWLFYARYSVEGDKIHVVEKELY